MQMRQRAADMLGSVTAHNGPTVNVRLYCGVMTQLKLYQQAPIKVLPRKAWVLLWHYFYFINIKTCSDVDIFSLPNMYDLIWPII